MLGLIDVDLSFFRLGGIGGLDYFLDRSLQRLSLLHRALPQSALNLCTDAVQIPDRSIER